MNNSTIKKIFVKGSFLTLVVFLAFLINCSENVENIKRDVPPIPNGINILIINTANTDLTAGLDSYTLTVVGSDGTTTTIEGTSGVDSIQNVTSDTYTISSSKTGYIGKTEPYEVVLPADVTENYIGNVFLTLTKANDPVTIDAATGGTISSPGSAGSGTSSSATVVDIPPGALASAGTTAISVTPIPPSTTGSGASSAQGTTINFQPDGVVFDVPITITIPLDIAPAIVPQVTPLRFSLVDASGALTGEFVDLDVAADGQSGSAQISHFSSWTVDWSGNYSIVTTFNSSESRKGVGCGENYKTPFNLNGTYGSLYAQIKSLGNANASNISIKPNYTGVAGTKTTIKFSYGVLAYDIINLTDSRIEETRTGIPNKSAAQSWVAEALETCHNSGGG